MDTEDFARKEYGSQQPPAEEDTTTTTTKEEHDSREPPEEELTRTATNEEHGHPPPTARDATQSNLSINNAGINTNLTQPPSRERNRLRRPETRLASKESHPWQHLGITLGLPMIILFDIVVPCIIYYVWWRGQLATRSSQCHYRFPGMDPCPVAAPAQFNAHISGASVASFGVGELWILLARAWRLFREPEVCGPLLNTNRWQLDATSWVYLAAMVVAVVPFLVGSVLEIEKLFLYGPAFLMGFLGLFMVVTLLPPFKIPVRINSQPQGTLSRPFIYYAAEDFMAVDGLQDREFRIRYNERYESNPMFRRLFVNLTLWWILGVCVYLGCVSAVIWTLEFHYAFGLSLGVLFSYITVWAVVTFVWVKLEMKREHEAYERGDFDV